MALTTEDVQVPKTPSQPRGRSARPILGWVAVGAAVLTTGVLAVAILTPDGEPADRILHYDVGDAKDHTNYNARAAVVAIPPDVNHAAAASDNASPAGNGDAKDHTNYNPIEATNANPAGNGDAKDHTNYNPIEATNANPAGNGDAKDHTNYNPIEATNANPAGNGDAKDHTNYNPVEATDASPAGNGDAKDHTNYNPIESDPV